MTSATFDGGGRTGHGEPGHLAEELLPDLRGREYAQESCRRVVQVREVMLYPLGCQYAVARAHRVGGVYPAGHCVWSAGDVSDHFLHVEAGRVRCTATDGAFVDVGSGFTIGVLDVWSTRRRVYEARTVTPVIASRIDFERFLTLLEIHPEVGLELLRGFARELLLAGM